MDNNYLEKSKWVIMNMRLNGDSMSIETATKIAEGEYVLEATLEEHLHITRLIELLQLMRTLFSMQESLSVSTLNKFYHVLSGGSAPTYRKTTPILFHLSYNPVLPQEIEEELANLFKEIHKHEINDPIKTANYIHNNLIRIYPFDDYNEIIARAALEYYLISCGKEMKYIDMSEQEYNTRLSKYLNRKGEITII